MEVQFQNVKANDIEQFKDPQDRGDPLAAGAEDRRPDVSGTARSSSCGYAQRTAWQVAIASHDGQLTAA